jgi:hypothetical protein
VPDPLDPIEALYSGIGRSFLTFGGFLGVSICGHVLGVQTMEIATVLATGGTGWSPLQLWENLDAVEMAGSWVSVFIESLFTLFGVPFLLLDVWLLARLRGGYEMQPVLFTLALTQPIHTAVILARGSSSTPTELILGAALLFVALTGLAFLLLWWRQVMQEHERADAESEMEL